MHHWFVLAYMLMWMFGPLAVFWQAPRKRRDPYLWVFAATILGPPVAIWFLLAPPSNKPA